PQDALGIAEKQWQQLEHQFDLPDIRGEFTSVVFAGMGGSALGALLSTSWPGHSLPFTICRDYEIPEYVGPKTLFIASSYSGNTEETLAALEQAEANAAVLAVPAYGGKLAERAKEQGYLLASLPESGQPRFAALVGLRATIAILEKAGLTGEAGGTAALSAA